MSWGRCTTVLGGLKAYLGQLPARFWGGLVGVVLRAGGSKLFDHLGGAGFGRKPAPQKIDSKNDKSRFLEGLGGGWVLLVGFLRNYES